MKKNKYITVGVCVAVLANIITSPTIAIAESVTEKTVDTTETVIEKPAKELPAPAIPPKETTDTVTPEQSTNTVPPTPTPTPAPSPTTPNVPAKDATTTSTSNEKQPATKTNDQPKKETKDLNGELFTVELSDLTVNPGTNIFSKIEESIIVRKLNGQIARADEYVVTPKNTIDSSVPGTYTMTVQVYFVALNAKIEKTVTVVVLETAKESITLNASDRVIVVGETFDPREGVSAFETKPDGSIVPLPFKEDLHGIGISYSGKVDTTTVGNYPVTYKVKNSQGQSIKKTVIISVVEASTSSLRIISEDATIMQGATFNPHIYAILIDSTEGHVYNVLTVSGDKVDSSVLGAEYYVTFNAEYKGNIAEPVTIKITVVGRYATINTDDQTVNVGDTVTEADILSWATANDPVDGDNLPITDYTVLDGPIDTSVPGNQFSIKYSFTNSAGNTTTETITLIVANLPTPTLKVEDKELFVGDKLTEDMILEWAEAENATAISYEVLGAPIRVNRLDNTLVEAGLHKIKFTATNDQPVHNTSELKPRTVEKTITLTVKDKDGKTPKDPKDPISPKDPKDPIKEKDTVNLNATKAKTEDAKKTKGDKLTKTNVSLGAMPAFGGVSAAIGSIVAYFKGKKKK